LASEPYETLKSLVRRENPFVNYLNRLSILQETGLRFCPKKSGLVRIKGVWLKPYKSFGLCLYTKESLWNQILLLLQSKPIPLHLRSNTRGRGENPITGKKGTLPQKIELNFTLGNKSLTLPEMLTHYRPYFGLLMAKLYGGETTETNLKLKSKKGSYLRLVQSSHVNKVLATEERFDLYNCGSKFNNLFLKLVTKSNSPDLTLITCPELKRSLKVNWTYCEKDHLTTELAEPFEQSKINSTDPASEYFKKFGELKLSKTKLQEYKTSYEENKKRNGIV